VRFTSIRFAASEQTLPRLHLIGTLAIVLVLTLTLGAFFSWRSHADHRASLERVGQTVIAQQQSRLQAELDAAISYLEFTRSRTEDVLRKSLREQVDTAMQVAQAIYERESPSQSPEKVKRLIADALRQVRFYDGRGYYFIDNMQGQFILLPTAPQLEGKTNLDNQDDRGHYIMRGLIDAARQPNGQGYSRYRWYSPDSPKEMADKLAYVRHFAPYDWLIGTGDYTYKWEQAQKQEVISRLRAQRFGQTGYFALLSLDGQVILSQAVPQLEGKHFQDVPAAQRAVIRQLLDKARQGGGFVHYDWPDVRTGSIGGKTGLVRLIEPWNWVMVATIQDNELQLSLQQELTHYGAGGLQRWSQWLVPLLLALLLGVAASYAFSRWSNRLFTAYHDDIRTKAQAIADSAALFRAVFDNAAVGIAQLQPDGRVLQVNQCYCSLLGYTAAEFLQPDFNARQLIPAEDQAANQQQMQQLLSGQADDYHLDKHYQRKDGSLVWANLAVHLVRDGAGAPQYVIAAAIDITERKNAEGQLRLAASVFTHAREGIMITEVDGTIVNVNDSFTRITGYSREEALGQNPSLLSSGLQNENYYADMWRGIEEKGHWYGELWNRRKNGEIYAEMQTVSVVRDKQGHARYYVALFSDVTLAKEHQRQLEHIAHFDALTNLPNRVLLADRLTQAMLQSQRRGQLLAVVYLDLDGFKGINDTWGHDVGDLVLLGVATRMKGALREGDTLARIGGDEFVAVLVDLPDTAACQPLLGRLLGAAAEPTTVDGQRLQVSASLGVTFFPQPEEMDADQLQRQADQAMYQAKLAGKNRYHVFDAEQDRNARGYFESVEHIRLALQNEELVLYYQPKVQMRSGKVIGAEALIRWQHPKRGLLAPAQFLPVIESHPLAVDVGEWVIRSALNQMACWHAQGLDLPVSVNVGARQLQQTDFVTQLTAILAQHPDIKPGCLELEVLETSALEDISGVSQVIEACRALGVTFALDDFGTGYSSLTYLKRLPVTLLKIDQSFVRDMLDDEDDLAILKGVIGLAQAFHREVIAEGVETIAHGTALLQLGCELAQGYGIARPMPAAEMPGWAAHWQPDAAWQL
jgi:diguanylate cyclase (GGDEF)-like protein/PAS domain S-box-containing protein